MIAYEKGKKLVIIPGGNSVDGWGHEDGKDYLWGPDEIPEANGLRVMDDNGTKKCLIGTATDLFEDPEEDDD